MKQREEFQRENELLRNEGRKRTQQEEERLRQLEEEKRKIQRENELNLENL